MSTTCVFLNKGKYSTFSNLFVAMQYSFVSRERVREREGERELECFDKQTYRIKILLGENKSFLENNFRQVFQQ